MSCQSSYSASTLSGDISGPTPARKMYDASFGQLGQYMSRDASNVVPSHMSIPICEATLRAIGSYSSGVIVRSVGMTIRSLGRCCV